MERELLGEKSSGPRLYQMNSGQGKVKGKRDSESVVQAEEEEEEEEEDGEAELRTTNTRGKAIFRSLFVSHLLLSNPIMFSYPSCLDWMDWED